MVPKSVALFLAVAVFAVTLSSSLVSALNEQYPDELDSEDGGEFIRALRGKPHRIYVGRREMDDMETQEGLEDYIDEEKRGNPRRHLFIGKRMHAYSKRRRPQRVFIG